MNTMNSERIWNIALYFEMTQLTTHNFTTWVTEQLASLSVLHDSFLRALAMWRKATWKI